MTNCQNGSNQRRLNNNNNRSTTKSGGQKRKEEEKKKEMTWAIKPKERTTKYMRRDPFLLVIQSFCASSSTLRLTIFLPSTFQLFLFTVMNVLAVIAEWPYPYWYEIFFPLKVRHVFVTRPNHYIEKLFDSILNAINNMQFIMPEIIGAASPYLTFHIETITCQ